MRKHEYYLIGYISYRYRVSEFVQNLYMVLHVFLQPCTKSVHGFTILREINMDM
jgi:hypothetical protein